MVITRRWQSKGTLAAPTLSTAFASASLASTVPRPGWSGPRRNSMVRAQSSRYDRLSCARTKQTAKQASRRPTVAEQRSAAIGLAGVGAPEDVDESDVERADLGFICTSAPSPLCSPLKGPTLGSHVRRLEKSGMSSCQRLAPGPATVPGILPGGREAVVDAASAVVSPSLGAPWYA